MYDYILYVENGSSIEFMYLNLIYNSSSHTHVVIFFLYLHSVWKIRAGDYQIAAFLFKSFSLYSKNKNIACFLSFLYCICSYVYLFVILYVILNLSLGSSSQLFNNMMLIKVKDTILGNELVTGIINVWKTVHE